MSDPPISYGGTQGTLQSSLFRSVNTVLLPGTLSKLNIGLDDGQQSDQSQSRHDEN